MVFSSFRRSLEETRQRIEERERKESKKKKRPAPIDKKIDGEKRKPTKSAKTETKSTAGAGAGGGKTDVGRADASRKGGKSEAKRERTPEGKQARILQAVKDVSESNNRISEERKERILKEARQTVTAANVESALPNSDFKSRKQIENAMEELVEGGLLRRSSVNRNGYVITSKGLREI